MVMVLQSLASLCHSILHPVAAAGRVDGLMLLLLLREANGGATAWSAADANTTTFEVDSKSSIVLDRLNGLAKSHFHIVLTLDALLLALSKREGARIRSST
jgi:hypothetical protein